MPSTKITFCLLLFSMFNLACERAEINPRTDTEENLYLINHSKVDLLNLNSGKLTENVFSIDFSSDFSIKSDKHLVLVTTTTAFSKGEVLIVDLEKEEVNHLNLVQYFGYDNVNSFFTVHDIYLKGNILYILGATSSFESGDVFHRIVEIDLVEAQVTEDATLSSGIAPTYRGFEGSTNNTLYLKKLKSLNPFDLAEFKVQEKHSLEMATVQGNSFKEINGQLFYINISENKIYRLQKEPLSIISETTLETEKLSAFFIDEPLYWDEYMFGEFRKGPFYPRGLYLLNLVENRMEKIIELGKFHDHVNTNKDFFFLPSYFRTGKDKLIVYGSRVTTDKSIRDPDEENSIIFMDKNLNVLKTYAFGDFRKRSYYNVLF